MIKFAPFSVLGIFMYLHASVHLSMAQEDSWKKSLASFDMHWNELNVELLFNLTYADGEIVQTYVERGDLVSDISVLYELNSLNSFHTQDFVSSQFYINFHTSTSNNTTLEDLLSMRSDVLQYLITKYKYTSYLEIGCKYDMNFNRIKPLVTHAVGVDPDMGGTLRMTSDEYFLSNKTEYFDLIFIDGMHEAYQVMDDIDNALQWLNPG